MSETLFQRGERRHEECRFGALTPGFWGLSLDPAHMKPIVLPLCLWKPNAPRPPAVERAWGGAIEYERDCAVCDAFRSLVEPEATP